MTGIEHALFGMAVLAYFVGSVHFVANLFLKHEGLGRAGIILALVGLFCHTVSLFLHAGSAMIAGAVAGAAQLATAAEGWSILAWSVTALFLAVAIRPKLRVMGAFALPATLIGSLVAASEAGNRPLLSGIPTWGLVLHVAASVISVGAFALAFGCAVCYLLQDRLLRQKRLGGLLRTLPPLDVLDTTSYWLVVLGFWLLTFGMISGAVLARGAWSNSWLTHPKTYVSLLLWLVYGGYLYVRGIAHWRGRSTHRAVVIAVVLVVILYGGASLVDRPVHSHAGMLRQARTAMSMPSSSRPLTPAHSEKVP